MTIKTAQLVAHRGHQDAFPENSLLAVIDAIAAGAINIELDIQVTREGVVVLYHDDNMQRISGINQSIIDITRPQLLHCYANEQARFGKKFIYNKIDTLKELFPYIIKYNTINFFLEIKKESLIALGHSFCLQAIKEAIPTLPHNAILISFDLDIVKAAKAQGFKKTGLVLEDWNNHDHLLKKANTNYGIICYECLPEDCTAIKACVPIILYEVDTISLAKKLLQQGIIAVETFCIRKLLGNPI